MGLHTHAQLASVWAENHACFVPLCSYAVLPVQACMGLLVNSVLHI